MKRALTALRPHPENTKIYGDSVDTALTASIKNKGILTPILITKTDLIMSGHRRWASAKAAGLTSAPVTVFQSTDDLNILEALIESNRQRVKSNEQIGREANALLGIEQARAKVRQAKAAQQTNTKLKRGKKTLVEPVPPPKTGKARDAVGSKLGTSGKTAEQAGKVVDTIDTLTKTGKAEEAEKLKKMLKKNVRKAHKAAKVIEAQTQPPLLNENGTRPRPAEKYITLDVWDTYSAKEQQQLIAGAPRKRKHGINKQKTDFIEWAQWSWNPVVGCLHTCPYCYARDIAENLYPNKFAPALVLDRLHAPRNIAVPPEAKTDIGYKNIFTCSMADLFGKWVPAAWIESVLAVVRESPQWNFLFLTKFPLRLAEFSFPANAWVGTSVDCQARVANAEEAFQRVSASVKWLSCEPLLEDLTFRHLDVFQWVVIGGSSASSQTPEFFPPRAWITHLWQQARAAGCQIYEKTNLLARAREYPGQHTITVSPSATLAQFHYQLLDK